MIDPMDMDDTDNDVFMSEYQKRMTMSKNYDWAGNEVKRSHGDAKREKNVKVKKDKKDKKKEASTTKPSNGKDGSWVKGYDSRSCAYGPGYHSYNGGSSSYGGGSSSSYKEGDLVFC